MALRRRAYSGVGWELLAGELLARRRGHDGEGVGAGVGIHADDEWVCVRDDGQGDRIPSMRGNSPVAKRPTSVWEEITPRQYCDGPQPKGWAIL